ncbi:hypothetical protein AT246_07010 [Bartonella henselae]|nr:hypothetical protein AT247_03515 [Bartonella henselae]OLL51695.1 hypothetical protein AT243_06555 [Bartonella henselae]OLL52003.1 hypothetical protein AT241_04715 [Bartonella henselae]OLL57972.1 hypothetical protein AT246_07010 [Bartonella henselae]
MRITIFESKDHKKKGIFSLLLTEIGSYYLRVFVYQKIALIPIFATPLQANVDEEYKKSKILEIVLFWYRRTVSFYSKRQKQLSKEYA